MLRVMIWGMSGATSLNTRLGLNVAEEIRSLTREDIVAIIRHIIMINNGKDHWR